MKKEHLIEVVKKNKALYFFYKSIMNTLLKCLKIFIKTDNKLILFVSYGGRYYNDSPKCIYEKMMLDKRFNDYKLFWAFRDPSKFDNIYYKVKIDTIKYFIIALKARCWVTNVIIERALNFKGKNTYYFHTTHGILPKLGGYDANKNIFGSDFKVKYDTSISQSLEEAKYQKSIFGLNDANIKIYGYPKNDYLCLNYNRLEIVDKLKLPNDKKIILYAPTYREDGINDFKIDINLWKKEIGDKYILLLRLHPTIIHQKDSYNNDFAFDVSSYDNNSELMQISDILISDYSGIFFEYAILERPMYCFSYDYEKYQKERGLYFDIRKEVESFDNQFDLINSIKNNNFVNNIQYVRRFKEKYIAEYGNATQKCVNDIFENIKGEE